MIRREEKRDFPEVENLVQRAFENAQHRDGQEHLLVSALRKDKGYIPELSLVAVVEGVLVGHIMFTEVKIGESRQVALAPLSVDPDFQNRGIGRALMEEGHRIAKELGYDYSIVLGSEVYYPKVGYQPASQFNIHPPLMCQIKTIWPSN